ncbi:amidohydrolase family protein [soil metagenome]
MKRRTFLSTTTAACLSPLSAEAAAVYSVVDTHTHFYDPSRPQGVPWPGKGTPLYRTVLPDDWAKLALPHGVTSTVVVEASAWLEDNQWILDLAANDKRIVGFVGRLDPLATDFAANLKRFSANPIFRGIRLSSDVLVGSTLKPEFLTAMKLLAEQGLQIDVNGGGGPYLEAIATLARTIPDLRIVIDHVGGAGDPTQLKDEWKKGMQLTGKNRNVFCKVSALAEQTKTEFGQAPQDTAFYLPILDHVWNSFSEDRVIYGSNWPVSDKGAPYDVIFRIVKEYFSAKGSAAEEKYFYKNSQLAYRWVAR